ncbi:hypothetical protein HAZT_HAZT011015, partial [Hyalella azteca]
SLHNLFTSVALSLALANHNVTLISSFPASAQHDNLHYVYALGEKKYPTDNIFEAQRQVDAFTILLNAALFVGIEYFAIRNAGNWLSPAVVPYILLPYDENMTFLERVVNVVTLVVSRYAIPYFFFSKQEELLRKFFPEFGDVLEYYDRVSLTLINGHPALDNPVPLLPSQVYIGTINAHLPRPLPMDLEQVMQSSGDAGVIYFSIGSVAVSKDIPARAKAAFLEAFARVPQKVLWKYEGDDLKLPDNVVTRSWLPQQDILGHPKTRLFISHCGNLGTQEAKYHGVPILAVPVAFDQPRNAARMVQKGLALALDWHTLTADDIVSAIDELVNNTSYSERIQNLSAILKDQMETPQRRAVWHIEHFIKNQGAPHLHYPGKNLHFLQYICLDVVLFLLLLLYIVCRLSAYFLRAIGRRVFRINKRKLKTR